MALAAGSRLGPYEIVAPIGAGGMGEVYKARDTRLDRTVAIKTSTRQFVERFQREAQAIAALNHANICTLHDVGADYLVMEFLDGRQLKGPLPVPEALRYAIQIAEAVSHAHKHGVIHRDLKPGNILVTKSGIKVLDFGLAKMSRAAAAAGEATMTQITQESMLVGTPRYMAPEQLEGKEADARSDIFAFGLVLYEMLTGRAAFDGKTQASVIAAIMTAEPPPVTSFELSIPPALDHLVRTCLEKDPGNRQQDMHDVLLQLKWIAGHPSGDAVAGRKRAYLLPWSVAAVIAAAALGVGMYPREKPAPLLPVRFEIPLRDPGIWGGVMPALSRDGRSVAYAISAPGSMTLTISVRDLDSFHSRPVPGTEGATCLFWSPDKRYLAFCVNRQLKKIDINGGPAQLVMDRDAAQGDWGEDGSILVGGRTIRLLSNGSERPLLKPDDSRKEVAQLYPRFLPGGKRFVYTSLSAIRGESALYLGSLDGGTPQPLVKAESNSYFVSPDILVFTRGNDVYAQRLNVPSFKPVGEPFVVGASVSRAIIGTAASVAASANGVLVYREPLSALTQPNWTDRSGRVLGPAADARPYVQMALSPDERRVAFQIFGPIRNAADIWQLDLSTRIVSRVTSETGSVDPALWSASGRDVLFAATDRNALNRKPVGGGETSILWKADQFVFPAQELKDGSIIFHNPSGYSVWLLPSGAAAGAVPRLLHQTDYAKDSFHVSPDERWISYSANETGRWEVYVAAFPSFKERIQVSNNGGAQGLWRKDGKELFYLALDGSVQAVEMRPGAQGMEAGAPKMLFRTKIPVRPTSDQFAVTGDGRRFLLLEAADPDVKPWKVVLNWPATLPPGR
ncbi:MAG TPA: protein kinase [Bryobacteraceae bacterium]|nr:protein kinase [Bryobacteraceae bacterium]